MWVGSISGFRLGRALGLGLALSLSACGSGPAGGGSCTTVGEQCGGATSCYAKCFCEQDDVAACQSRCSLATDSPLLLDVSGWPPDAETDDLLARINEQRSAGGCCAPGSCFAPAPALTTDLLLKTAARRHAADMTARAYFSHDTPEGLTFEDRLRAAGYRGCSIGENLAAAYTTAEEVVDAWLASTDHCQNLFRPTFSNVGLARSTSQDETTSPLWVADFGG